MRKLITIFILLFTTVALRAQTVSTFDNLILPANSYWDGSDLSGGFTSGNSFFPNVWDTAWGGYWAAGWTYSNQTDTALIAPSPSQLYCSRDGGGFNASANFGIGTQGSVIKFTGAAAGNALGGLYVTNTTYNFNSMAQGDAFAKKFGGASGNDADWFKLVVRKYLGGSLAIDSVEFYLADFRFSNNTQDYILKDWAFVNLTSLGNCDSILISLSSSDVGGFGMNTPAYYCIDNLITMNSPAGVAENTLPTITVFPTVCNEVLHVLGKEYSNNRLTIIDMNGKTVLTENYTELQHRVDVSALSTGMYILQVMNDKQEKQEFKIIKQ